jgi:NitT/TauT family transport system substrate-binding protein
MRAILSTAGVFVAAASILATAGCSTNANGNGSTSAKGASNTVGAVPSSHTVTIAIDPSQGSINAAQYTAEGIGAFEQVEHKFHVQINFPVLSGSGTTFISAIQGGSADAGEFAGGQVMKAVAQGVKLTSVFSFYTGGIIVLVAQKKYQSSRGTDIAKFNGATWGYTAAASTTSTQAEAVAKHFGLAWNKQMQVALGSPAAMEPALAAGRADIIAMNPQSAAEAVTDGTGYIVFNSLDPSVAGPILGQQMGAQVVFSTSFTKSYPQLTQAIVGAYVAGLRRVQKLLQNPAAVLGTFTKQYQDYFRSGFAKTWELEAPALKQGDGAFSPESIKETENFGVEYGLLPTSDLTPAISSAFDNSFVNATKASG